MSASNQVMIERALSALASTREGGGTAASLPKNSQREQTSKEPEPEHSDDELLLSWLRVTLADVLDAGTDEASLEQLAPVRTPAQLYSVLPVLSAPLICRL
jgi:hypothetical protein